MADDGSAQANIWPMPAFHFKVTFGAPGGFSAVFQEVSGLDTESQVIEYRHGDSQTHSLVKMPGLTKVRNATLKRGVFKNDDAFKIWSSSMPQNTIKRQSVVIELLDENGAPTMKWTLTNAWPTKMTGGDLNADGDEVAVHSLELAFESLSVANS